jgi:nicotinate phosphoribosyltransferase
MTMAYAYWRSGRLNEKAVFEAFFRKHPFKGKFCIFAGVDEVLQFLKTFKFEKSHLDYLRSVMCNVEEDFLNWLGSLDTSSVKVYGIP